MSRRLLVDSTRPLMMRTLATRVSRVQRSRVRSRDSLLRFAALDLRGLFHGSQNLFIIPGLVVILQRTIKRRELAFRNEVGDNLLVPVPGPGVNALRREVAKVDGLLMVAPSRRRSVTHGAWAAFVRRDVVVSQVRERHRSSSAPRARRRLQPPAACFVTLLPPLTRPLFRFGSTPRLALLWSLKYSRFSRCIVLCVCGSLATVEDVSLWSHTERPATRHVS